MLCLRNRLEVVPAIALVLICSFSTACTAWHTTSLEPQRFSAEQSPEKVRLTFREGTAVIVRHPILVGDSLIWAGGSGETPRDSARSAVPTNNIWRVEVHEPDSPRTLGLFLVVLGVVVGGFAIIVHELKKAIG